MLLWYPCGVESMIAISRREYAFAKRAPNGFRPTLRSSPAQENCFRVCSAVDTTRNQSPFNESSFEGGTNRDSE